MRVLWGYFEIYFGQVLGSCQGLCCDSGVVVVMVNKDMSVCLVNMCTINHSVVWLMPNTSSFTSHVHPKPVYKTQCNSSTCLPACLPACPSAHLLRVSTTDKRNLESSREETRAPKKGKGKMAAAKVPWSPSPIPHLTADLAEQASQPEIYPASCRNPRGHHPLPFCWKQRSWLGFVMCVLWL